MKPPATPALPIAVADEAAFFGLLDLERPELAAVKRAVQEGNWTAAKAAWARHLETRTSPTWVWSRRDKAHIMAFLEARNSSLKSSIEPADTVLRREFTPQGIKYQLEKNVDWQLKLSEETHVLSRFAYWRDMGRAYWQTGDSKYSADFVYLLKDWLEDNPAPRDLSGVIKANTRWRSLEAGIRVVNWWEAMELFMDAPEFDAQAKYQMSKSLMEHARYLYEWTPKFRGGNWQVSEAGGLAIMGIMMPEAKDAATWRERGLARLIEHMEKDVLPDGAHSELTPGYHQWVMSQFTQMAQLCKLNGYNVPALMTRHELMFDWYFKMSRPNRFTAAVGDTRGANIENDMAMGALLYNRPDMRFLGPKEVPTDFIWTLGADALKKYAALPSKAPDFTSFQTPDSQYLTMRTGWAADDKYLLFDAAPGGAGHHHQDKLQVTLYAGRDLIVDPGMYAYNQPLATTYFRTPEAHNALVIDGKSSPASNDPKFNPKVVAWQTTPQSDFASAQAEFNGFKHQRSVVFLKPNYWIVVDHISSTGPAADAGPHEVKRFFHFPLGETRVNGNSASTAFATGTNLQIQVPDKASLQMEQGWFPTGGVTAEAAPVATYLSRGALPLTLCTVLTPFTDPKAVPQVETVPGPKPEIAHLKLVFPDGQRDEILVAPQPTALAIGAQTAQARALCIRQGPQSNATIIVAK